MLNTPVLMLPAFRSGRDTPWAGDALRRFYEKYTMGNQIGESYDFSLIPSLESTSPDGKKLSELLQRANIISANVPFLIKWVDAEKAMSVHVHTHDEYFIVVRTYGNAALYSCCKDIALPDLKKALTERTEESILQAIPLAVGDVVYVPAGSPHAIQGATCYQIHHPSSATYRLYDWDRVNARGQKRQLQLEQALDWISAKQPVHLSAANSTIIETDHFHTMKLINLSKHPLAFGGRFAVLTCLESSLMRLDNGRHLYLSAGQSVFLPSSNIACTLTTPQSILTVSLV